MQESNQKIINFTAFAATTICFAIGAIAYSPVFVVYYAGFLLTIGLFGILNKNRQEFADTVTIFLLTSLFGFILAFMVNMDFLDEGTTYLYPDQMDFFEQAASLSRNNSMVEIIKYVNENFIEYKLIYSLFGILAYFDFQSSGFVNFLPLLFSVVYITALIPVFLYHTTKIFLPRKISLQSTLYYALLTPMLAYSGFLLRDMHVALITVIALFWLVREVNVGRIVGITLLIPIIAGMRLSNSFLILAMLLIYVFAGKSSKFIKVMAVATVLAVLAYFSGDLINNITSTSNRIERYQEFTQSAVDKSDGLSKYFYSLPPVLKETSIILIELIAFPFISEFSSSMTAPQHVMAFYNSITNMGWFLIFFGFIFFIIPILKSTKNAQNKTLFFLILLFFLYMYMNTSNMTFRRLICAFPFIYIPFLIEYNKASAKIKKRYISSALITGVGLSLLYFILKF